MKPATLCLLLLLALPARAQDLGAYASGIWGNGSAYGGNTSGDRMMKWRALELRFGRELGALPAGVGRVDFVHYNEGHPHNNHRDGFAIQLAYAGRLSSALTAELAVGPYLSMNTTEIGGVQIDDSNLGMLASLALRVSLDRYARGLHLRLGVNHAAMRDVHQSNALLVGIGRQFADVPPFPQSGLSSHTFWLGAAIGNSITNHSKTDGAFGGSLELRQYRGKWATSVAAVIEGDDGSRVDRRGIAGLVWFVQPVTDKWALSAGAGPYFAQNRYDLARHAHMHALITLQAERDLSERVKAFVSFSRVKTLKDRNDRDLFRIGLLTTFGG